MIPTLLALLAVRQATQTPAVRYKASPAEIARIRAFVRLVAIDQAGIPFSKAALSAEPVQAPRGDWLGRPGYHVGDDIGVSLSPVTGFIVGYGAVIDHSINRPSRPRTDSKGHPGLYPAPRRISDEEAKAFVARVFAATGQPYGVDIYGFHDGVGGNGDNISVELLPTYRGVPYVDDYAASMNVDRETGQLEEFLQRREPPIPPSSVVPGGSAEEAHLVALRAAVRSRVAVQDFPKPHVELSISALDSVPEMIRPTTSPLRIAMTRSRGGGGSSTTFGSRESATPGCTPF